VIRETTSMTQHESLVYIKQEILLSFYPFIIKIYMK